VPEARIGLRYQREGTCFSDALAKQRPARHW